MIGWIISLIIADLGMGLCVVAAIANMDSSEYKGGKLIAIIVFWPILAIIGMISIIAKTYLKGKE